jgi:hypothetical protein
MIVTTPPKPRTKFGLAPSLINPAWTAGQEEAIEGLFARVELETGSLAGTTFEVSRLAGEAGWTIDAAYSRRGMPLWANGYGARYLRTRALAPELAMELDALVPTTTPQSNRDWSAEQGVPCAECGHVPGEVPGCECCALATTYEANPNRDPMVSARNLARLRAAARIPGAITFSEQEV